MSKHTPEPWQAHQDASGDVFISSAATSFHIAEIGSEDDDTAIPDARRIVACVNACRGLPTDELEQKGLVAAVGTQLIETDRQCDELRQERQREHALRVRLTGELEVASQQRDELLAALDEISKLPSYRQDECSEMARDAIAKANGGAS